MCLRAPLLLPLLLCGVNVHAQVDTAPFFAAAAAGAKQVLVMLECKDDAEGCPSWAGGGECAKNPGFMHTTCRKSCGKCEFGGQDKQHALEIAAYAARNLHAGCSATEKDSSPACAPSADRLAAVLAVTQRGLSGKNVQRFLEAAANEIAADAQVAARAKPPATYQRPAPTEETRAASIGPLEAPSLGDDARYITLSDGGKMPAVGFGTWLTVGKDCFDLVTAGLRAGLRHIDTSENYANHEEIGKALAASGILRSEIFLADKLSFPHSYSAAGVRKAVAEALRKMQVEYLDLYMLHSVGPSPEARHEAWREMAALQKEGTIKHIGVSNFGTAELRDLKRKFPEAPPATLQSKFNPYHRGRTGNAGGEDFHQASAELGVAITAYCPLNDWPSKLKAVDDAHVGAIAARLGRTPAQVLLRWGVQLGLSVLTRSRKEERLRQATQIFDFALSADDMALISGLAWFVQAPTNKVPASVLDTYGVQARDAEVRTRVPQDKPHVAQPIQACDMAWNMLGGSGKIEL